ncbi:MAG: hypothetical protein EBV23_04485 [Flavobacteriia bacterium]|jgi:ABC-type multidrug transport system fused ATPase/permease subunit|nr:hypothetical protein [Flavobacteriia bacterium]
MKPNQMAEEEWTESAKKPKAKKQSALMIILNGDFLTKDFVLNNLAYILFLFLLLFILVAKGYYGKSLVKKVQETRTELDQNTADYIETKTLFEERTRRYKMVERLKKKKLVESENAIQVIKSNAIRNDHEEQ